MRSAAFCKSCDTLTSHDKLALYGDWVCLCCDTEVEVLTNSQSANRETWNAMTVDSLQVGHPDRNVGSLSEYKASCKRNGVNPDSGEFNTTQDQVAAVDKSLAGKKKGIRK